MMGLILTTLDDVIPSRKPISSTREPSGIRCEQMRPIGILQHALLLLAIPSGGRAQVVFSAPVPYGQNIYIPAPFATTIRQGDTPDLVLASRSPGRIVSLSLTGDTVLNPIELKLSGYERGQLAFADMNGDGLEDVVTTERRYLPIRTEIALYLNLGNGRFAPRVAESLNDEYLSGVPMAFGDVNGDGILDVVHRKAWSYSPATNSLVDVGHFTLSYPTQSVACYDLNGDGIDEVIFGGGFTPYAYVSYIDMATPSPSVTNLVFGQTDIFHVAVADVNADGLMDILFGGVVMANKVILQTAPMVFATNSVITLSVPITSPLTYCWYNDPAAGVPAELWCHGASYVFRASIDAVTFSVTVDTMIVSEDAMYYARLLDVNRDGLNDLVITSERGECRVSYGTSGNTFDGLQRVFYHWSSIYGEHVDEVPVPGSPRQQALVLGKGYSSYISSTAASLIPQTRYPYNTPSGDFASAGRKHNGLIEADLDQDGHMDLLRVTCSTTCRLGFIKDWKMPGAFETCIAPTEFMENMTEHASVWDWNDDGLLDIVLTGTSRDWAPGSASVPFHLVLTRQADGTFITNNTPLPPEYFTYHADLDGNDHLDLIVADTITNALIVYANQGNGVFELRTTAAYEPEQFGVLSHSFTDVPAYHGRSKFFPLMDVDGNGRLDMVRFKKQNGWMDLYYQSIDLDSITAPVKWIELAGYIGANSEALFMDLDRDNDMDLLTTHGNYLRIRMNNGDLPITAYTTLYLPLYALDFIPFDADGDDLNDLLLYSGSNQFHVLYNQTPRAYRSDGTFRLYPNPSLGPISVDLGRKPAGTARIELFDAMGRTALQLTTSLAFFDLDLGHLTSGVYIMRAFDETEGRMMGVQRLVLTDP